MNDNTNIQMHLFNYDLFISIYYERLLYIRLRIFFTRSLFVCSKNVLKALIIRNLASIMTFSYEQITGPFLVEDESGRENTNIKRSCKGC